MLNVIIKWTRRLIVFVLCLVVALYLALLAGFQVSKIGAVNELEADSEVIATARGPMEVYIKGDLSSPKPVLLVPHGTPGGYDQGVLMTVLFDDQYTYIIPSRPGYLRTPISTGRTPAEQADAYAALLDALRVEAVSVIGASGSGPSALEFARRHPDRVTSLVLFAPVVQTLPDTSVPPISSVEQVTNALFGQGFMEWAFTRPLIWFPENMTLFASLYPDSWPRLMADEQKLSQFTKLVESSLLHYPEDLRFEGYKNDRAQFSQLDMGSFAKLSAPTLIIHGTADTNVPFDPAQSLSNEIEGVQTLWLEQGDHIAFFSRSEEILPVMNDFLKTHTALASQAE